MKMEMDTSIECGEPQNKKSKEDLEQEKIEVDSNLQPKQKNPGVTAPNPLSKNQLKKQKKLEKYEQNKRERRFREREKQKRKKQEALAQGLPTRTGPSRKELKKRQIAADKNPSTFNVAIDLDYDDVMHERDIAKCVKQCLRIYTINRRSLQPGTLHLTGIKSEGHIHAAFKKNDGWENWNVNYHFDKDHTDVFPKEKLVYLTCESDMVLEHLQEDRVYVIGGLVDHNHHKGLCHERAIKAGVQTARLPLSEYVDMKTRAVLSTYHVFEILLHISGGKSWTDAILETIPMRKGAKAKQKQEENSIDAVEKDDSNEASVSNDSSSIVMTETKTS